MRDNSRQTLGLRLYCSFKFRLEARLLLASDWRNPVDALDVNGDLHVTPIDALWAANDLHRNGSRILPADRGGASPPFLDVNGDGFAAPSDVIRVIDALNAGHHSPYILEESGPGANTRSITIGLGQEYGPRVYTFGIDAEFDTSGDSHQPIQR
jgi:hypothetical protein